MRTSAYAVSHRMRRLPRIPYGVNPFAQDAVNIAQRSAIANASDVTLWDVASGRHVGDAYLGSPDHQYGTIRTLPDGRIVLMIENEPTFLYRADLASWKAQACSIVGEVTPAQWQTMVPDEPYRPTCAA